MVSAVRAYFLRLKYARTHTISSLYEYVLGRYGINYLQVDAVVSSLVDIMVSEGAAIPKKFYLHCIKSFELPSVHNKANFVFSNLEKTPVALYFSCVKNGIRCDYAMP